MANAVQSSSDCIACAQCVATCEQCSSSSSLTPHILPAFQTEQCTDQCVVIPCTQGPEEYHTLDGSVGPLTGENSNAHRHPHLDPSGQICNKSQECIRWEELLDCCSPSSQDVSFNMIQGSSSASGHDSHSSSVVSSEILTPPNEFMDGEYYCELCEKLRAQGFDVGSTCTHHRQEETYRFHSSHHPQDHSSHHAATLATGYEQHTADELACMFCDELRAQGIDVDAPCHHEHDCRRRLHNEVSHTHPPTRASPLADELACMFCDELRAHGIDVDAPCHHEHDCPRRQHFQSSHTSPSLHVSPTSYHLPPTHVPTHSPSDVSMPASHDILSPLTPPSASISRPTLPCAPSGVQPPILRCHWADCTETFTCFSKLANHVNKVHLSHISAPELPQPGPLCMYEPPNEADRQAETESRPTVGAEPGTWQNAVAGPSTSHASSTSDHNADTAMEIDAAFVDSSMDISQEPESAGCTGDTCPNPHVCRWKDCSESFTTCSDLTTHITEVHVGGGRGKYECFWEGCTRNGPSNNFSSKQKILRHIQSHTGHRPFKCDICGQHFSEAATLQQHKRRHTREKPYVCDYPGCGKAFAIAGAKTIHMRTHNGHKPFKCPYCDRSFAESSNLSKHVRTHTGARPYVCSEPGCGKSFARPDQLARHANTHQQE